MLKWIGDFAENHPIWSFVIVMTFGAVPYSYISTVLYAAEEQEAEKFVHSCYYTGISRERKEQIVTKDVIPILPEFTIDISTINEELYRCDYGNRWFKKY